MRVFNGIFSMCVLMGFYAFGTRFQSYWSRSFARKKPNAGQNCFLTVTLYFNFFSSACFFDIFHLCPCRFWHILLALILGGTLKSRISKRYSFNQASFQLEHPLRMQASSRFWLFHCNGARAYCRTTKLNTSLLRLLKV